MVPKCIGYGGKVCRGLCFVGYKYPTYRATRLWGGRGQSPRYDCDCRADMTAVSDKFSDDPLCLKRSSETGGADLFETQCAAQLA